MALEAGLSGVGSAPPRESFLRFANDVELTLYYLVAALRGAPPMPETLPDLREAHRALVLANGPDSRHSQSQQYAFMNIETDRITNSLNTLSEELARWIALRR
jgi:hypothetical protein